MQTWQCMHVGIPLYKYVVIDIISLFVPYIILSAISMLFFTQEKSLNEDGVTSLGKRIASGAGILLAYIAFLPTIRQRLPPTPSITFLELGVYLSTIPNLLGVIHAATYDRRKNRTFFDQYKPFEDPFFLFSFIGFIVLLCLLGLSIAVYLYKKYTCDYLFSRFKPSGLDRARNPLHMRYM